jgi:hypothetical protein
MQNEQTNKKQRHGCVTSLLILIIVVNSVAFLLYFFASEFIKNGLSIDLTQIKIKFFPDLTRIDKIILGISHLANLISCILLFQWKKIGFLVYVATNLGIMVFKIYQGKSISLLWSVLIGIAILYGVMQISTKNNKTTWDELS